MGLLEKAKRFFGWGEKEQLSRQKKLAKIIEKLTLKAKRLKKRYRKADSAAKKKRLLKEYKAVKKLLKRGIDRKSALDTTKKTG